ncbi:MAG TPA: XkdX family protein [Clostridiales bacterium]|nr:XkdX family protein [Clostridiales bacterium]
MVWYSRLKYLYQRDKITERHLEEAVINNLITEVQKQEIIKSKDLH